MRGLTAFIVSLLWAAAAAAQQVSVHVEPTGDGTRTLTHELVVPAGPEEVWEAVATVEGWRSWAAPVARTIAGTDRFETAYDLEAPEGSANTIEQAWVSRDPPRRAVFRTTRTPAGFPHAETYKRVVNTFILEPVGDQSTRVRLVGVGYAAGQEGDQLIAFFSEGNKSSLQALHARFVSGPIDWAARLKSKEGN